MKFKRAEIPLISGKWNKTYNRFDRKLTPVIGYTGTTILHGKEYQLNLVKQTDGWRLSIFGILGGKDFHFHSIQDAEERAEQAFEDYVFWKGERNLHRLEDAYRRLVK